MAFSEEVLRDKFRGAILGCFLGDAFGADLEGMDQDEAARYISDEFYGRYTDDTDMTFTVAESILQSGRVDPEAIAQHFSIHCNLSRGYGKGTAKAITALRAGTPWTQVGEGVSEKGSFGNGAAMRVSPVGLFHHQDLEELRKAAIVQAAVTHTHPMGQWGAVMQAVCVALAVLQDPERPFDKDETITKLREMLSPGPIEYLRALDKIEDMFAQEERFEAQEIVERLGHGFEAHLSVPAACYVAFAEGPDTKRAIRAAVLLGGDTDTIAAMTGAIVGAHGGEKGLPAEWMERLEDETRGRSFARDLSDRLFALWSRTRH